MQHSRRRKAVLFLLALVAIVTGAYLLLVPPSHIIEEDSLSSSYAPVFGVRIYAGADDDGAIHWGDIAPDAQLPDGVVLLIHGLDEPGDIWDDLAPRLAEEGFTVARFDYPNDQPIARSTDELADALRMLKSRGADDIAIVAHSMGGLVSRDALSRDTIYAGDARGGDHLPHITKLITIGTPNRGSPFAPLRTVAEIRERAMRWMKNEISDEEALFGSDAEDAGVAGVDLEPGSEFLTDLNTRPLPEHVDITIIAGRLGPVNEEEVDADAEADLDERIDELAEAAENKGVSITDLSEQLGDGVVPIDSTRLEGVDDYTIVKANHRAMLYTFGIEDRVRGIFGLDPATPPAIPIILDRLGVRQPQDF